MFEETIRTISDSQGSVERTLQSEFFTHFTGNRRAALAAWRQALAKNRNRLTRVERTLTDPLWVVLLGRFSSGKSSLINAIVAMTGGTHERLTGRHPTDKNATLILHESSNTGILDLPDGQQEIEGLGISVDRHSLDPLRGVILIDTPGFWEKRDTDSALMRFLGQADIILHCMTPDSLLNLADQAVLDERKKHFPSQVYQIVVTKVQTDTGYVDADGKLISEWDKDLGVLRNRFSGYTNELLENSHSARSHGVWLVDSKTRYGISELLEKIRLYATDGVDNVPRIRAPIIRDRLKFIHTKTAEEVVQPLGDSLDECRKLLSQAEELLTEERKRYIVNVVGPNRENLRLRIREIKHVDLGASIDVEIATDLGIGPLLAFQSSQPILQLNVALTRFNNRLGEMVETWKNTASSFPEYKLVEERHGLNEEIINTAAKNLDTDVRKAYRDWFDNRDCGQRLQALLGFDSVLDVAKPAVRRSPQSPARSGLQGEPSSSPPKSDASGAASTESEPTHNNRNDEKDGKDGTTSNDLIGRTSKMREDFPPLVDRFEEILLSVFQEGTNVILNSARTDHGSNLFATILADVREVIKDASEQYARMGQVSGVTGAGVLTDERTNTIVERVRDSVLQKVEEIVGSMRESYRLALERAHSELLAQGIEINLTEEESASLGVPERLIEHPALQVVNEQFKVQALTDFKNLAAYSKDSMELLQKNLMKRRDELQDLLQPNTALLRNTASVYHANSHNLALTAVKSLKVFGQSDHSPNFFEQKGIGGDLERDLTIDLAHVCDTMENERRISRIQLIGSGVAFLLFSAAEIALHANVISFSSSWSGSADGFLRGLIGVSIAGLLGSLWKTLGFRKKGRATLAQKAKDQMETICTYSRGNLQEEKRGEFQKFSAAKQAIRSAIGTFADSSVTALANNLTEQLTSSLQRLATNCEYDRRIIGEQMTRQLEAFRKNCHTHLDQVSDRTSEILRDGCSQTLTEWVAEAKKELNHQRENIESIQKEVSDAEKRMRSSFNLAP